MIEFKSITKKYDQMTVVHDISFTVDRGSLVVLIGPSGCGKTTLLKMINRLIVPTSGEIFINGKSIFKQNEIELRRNIGYVILMDEPFSALDPITRSQLQDELSDLQAKLRKTIVFVTHDMDEAVKIADKICLINEGSIVQYDTVGDMMKNPANEYVADFIGKNRIWSSPEFIRAQDIMINTPVCISPESSVTRCIERMRKYNVDSLMITNKQNILLGIVMAKGLQNIRDINQPVSQVMIKECQTVEPELNIVALLEIVNAGGLSSIPVVDKEMRLKGLITKTSLLTTLSQQYGSGYHV